MRIKNNKLIVLMIFFFSLSTCASAMRTLKIFNQETEPLDDDQKEGYRIEVLVNSANQGTEIPYGQMRDIQVSTGPFLLRVNYFSIKRFQPTNMLIPPGVAGSTICKAIDAYVGREYAESGMRQSPCPH